MRPAGKLGTLYVLAGLAVLAGGGKIAAALHCADPDVQLGDVRAGVPLARSFELVNRGQTVVAITGVHPSCGCLGIKLDQRRLAPGAIATLRLEINTLTQPAGPQTWRIRVRFDEGEQSGELELSLAARVITEVTVEPAALVFYTSSPIASQVTLRDRRPGPLTVTRATTTSEHVTATIDAPSREEGGHRAQRVNVHVGPDYPEGRHDETLTLFTDDPDYRELRVPFTVSRQARQRVTPAPASIAVFAAPGQAPPSRIVLLRTSGEESVDVLYAEADHPAILCTWAQGPGSMATLKVAFDPAKLPAEGLKGTVHVMLRGPKQERIDIPVECTPH